MTDTRQLFALAEADDAGALIAVLGDRQSFQIHSESGETLYLFCLFRGRGNCAAALKARGGLTLHEASAAGDETRVASLLEAAPWTVQTLSADGWPALHLAAFLGHDATLLALLTAKADPLQWARAIEQNLAIHAGAAGRRLGAAAYSALISATRDPDIVQKQGYTALMIASANGYAEGARALVRAGADRARKLPDGKTAADIALERGHAGLAEELR
jgi:ankyrin repeat protein